MYLTKYFYHSFVLLLLCGMHNKCMCAKQDYLRQEEEGYYMEPHYKLGQVESLENTIIISPDVVTKLRKQLENRIPEWLQTGNEQKPYELWHNFFNDIILENILKKLEAQHDTTLLKNYYDRFGNLFKAPTEANEKKVLEAIKKLQTNPTLEKAFKKCIAETYHKPESIYLTSSTGVYQQFISFILNDDDAKIDNIRHITIEKARLNLAKWQEDGHPTGQALWKTVQATYSGPLKASRIYAYPQNQEVINQMLEIMHQLIANPGSLSYKAIFETLPNGINKLKDILYEIGLEDKEDIKLLTTYLDIVSGLYRVYMD